MGQLFAKKTFPNDKHIVILGAGFGGAFLGLELLKAEANFTIINPSDVFHYNPASIRAIVVPGWAEKSMIPLETTFGSHFKRGKVASILPGEQKVLLESGEQLSYDLLVLATGRSSAWPYHVGGMDREQAALKYQDIIANVKESKSILIIGGGATGVEISGEVAAAYPDKKVTLIHGSEKLVGQRLNEKFQAKLKDMMQQLNISIILGEKVENMSEVPRMGPATVITDRGTSVTADMVFVCTGNVSGPNNDPCRENLSGALTAQGALRVDECLRVVGETNIYGLGDCTDIPEPKLALLTLRQVPVLTQTLKRVLEGKEPVAYVPDKGPAELALSLGPTKGLSQTKGGWLIPSFIITYLKSRTLLTDKMWATFGQKLP